MKISTHFKPYILEQICSHSSASNSIMYIVLILK